MLEKTLAQTNPYLQDEQRARRNRVRSLASSTAIETGEPIPRIEAKLTHRRPSRNRVTLA